tara:strand:- start:9892 stop:10515 length:624 start_codon:yes stop_codon:yes gene_type:complete
MTTIFLQGIVLQASLILALGAQNVFVLNVGVNRSRAMLVAIVSTLCDALLIFVGVLGVATLFAQYPLLKVGLGVLGVGFLFLYGALKLKEGGGAQIHSESSAPKVMTTKVAILMSLGFSLLNPHALLDTMVLIGGYATQFEGLEGRFYFGLGAATFSGIWFFALVNLASYLSRFLNSARAMSRISAISGVVLISIGFKLAADVYSWI